MQPKTLIALGAVAAIAVIAFLTMRAPEKGERRGPAPRPIPALKSADVKELDLDYQKGHLVLKLDGATWNIAEPGHWKADQQLAHAAVDQLAKITWGDVITENPAKFGDLEVSDDKGAHVVAKDGGGKVLFDGWVGKSASGFTMLRPAGDFGKKPEVWQAAGLFKYTFAKGPHDLRDHTIVEVKKDDVTKLSVESGAEKLQLERVADKAGDKWKVLSSTVKVDPLDDATANNLVGTLSSLRAADFDDGAKPADVGLQPPRIKLTVDRKQGAPVVLLVGKAKGDDSWVQLDGQPQIYLIQHYLLDRLAVAPRNFRDKTIVKVKEADLQELTITVGADSVVLQHAGSSWKTPKGELDDNKVKPVVSAFENLQAAEFADVDAKTAGLVKPAGSITLKTKDKPPIVVHIGALKDGASYYVQRVGSPDVLLLKKFVVDRFWKKRADLLKSATAAN